MTPYKILSCDGGGIRGLLTTIMLERLEEKLGSPLCNHFDMFAGTSTGSIIACCLAQGMSVSTIKNFYLKKGEDIFPNMDLSFWAKNTATRISRGDASLPLFTSEGLEKVLKDPAIFPQEKLFGNLLKPTIVLSYDTFNRTAVVFKSNDSKFAQISTWEICRSSSAAPVAFPGYFLTEENYLEQIKQPVTKNKSLNNPVEIPEYKNTKGIPLIDGGVVANNPSLCAIAERISLNKSENQKYDFDNIIVASFGTGQSIRRIKPEEAETWGGLDWVNVKEGIPMLGVFSDGSADVTDYIARQMIGENYYRFQPLLVKGVSTFQADKPNLDKITRSAEEFLANEGVDEYLNNLVEKLKTSN